MHHRVLDLARNLKDMAVIHRLHELAAEYFTTIAQLSAASNRARFTEMNDGSRTRMHFTSASWA